MKLGTSVCCLLAVLASANTIFAGMVDDFEGYAVGGAPGGTWIDFGGSQPFLVSTAQAHSGTKSMRLSEGTDTLANTSEGYGSDVFSNLGMAAPVTSGRHELSFWQFIEASVDSVAISFLSTGILPATYETGVELYAASYDAFGSGPSVLLFQDINNAIALVAPPAPIVIGRWVEHKYEINLDTNTYNFSYDGTPLVSGLQWDTTPGNGVSIGGINLWMQLGNANGINNFVYYDDFRFEAVPEPTTGGLWLAAVSGICVLRRKRN